MTTFRIQEIVQLKSSSRTVLIGDIIEGEISIGMKLSLDGKEITISAIEHVDGSINGKWLSRIGLALKTDDPMFFKNINSKDFIGNTVAILP
jgi:hypothetical protein